MEVINVVPELTEEEREEVEQNILQIFAKIQQRLKVENILKDKRSS